MTLLLADCCDDVSIRTSAIVGVPPIWDYFYKDSTEWKYGRGVDAYLFDHPSTIYYNIPPRSEIFVRFAFAWDQPPTSSSTFFSLLSGGVTVASVTYVWPSKCFLFKIGQTTVLDASSPDFKVFETDRWYDIDSRFKIDSVNGILETRYGGVHDLDFFENQGGLGSICFAGNTIPAGTTITTIDQIAFSNTCAGTTFAIGNIIINDTEGSTFNNFMPCAGTGPYHSDPWYDGSYDEWIYVGPGYKGSYNMWSSGGHIYTRVKKSIDSYAVDNPGGWTYYISGDEEPSSKPFHIVALETVASAKKSNPGLTMSFYHAFVMGATYCEPCWYSEWDHWYAYPGVGDIYYHPQAHILTTDYKLYASLWNTDPSTGSEWTEMDEYMDFDGSRMLQMAIRSWVDGDEEVRLEQLHLGSTNTEKYVLVLIDGIASETITPDQFHLYKAIHKPASGPVPAATFNDAVNNNDLSFTFGGSSGVGYWAPTTLSGLIAAQSGAITQNKNTYFIANVTGPGIIDFWWAVDSQLNADYLEFWIDNERQPGRISGQNATLNWAYKSYTLGSGTHELGWNYISTASGSAGRDAGFVRDIGWTPS